MARGSAKELVVALLLQSGFVPDGATRTQQVRIPTTKAPVFGHGRNPPGGELRTLGGRQRFARGNMRVTVGPYSTYFYPKVGDFSGPPAASFPTVDIPAIQAFLAKLPRPEAQP